MVYLKIKIRLLENWLQTFFLSFLLILLNTGNCLDLNIDNRLSVVPRDCYTRVSIGSRLADSLVISTSQANAVSDCEAACSANGTSCSSFSFGIGIRGNSTCSFAREIPKQPQDLQTDREYDVYAKGRVSLRGCRPNRANPPSLMSNQSGSTANASGNFSANGGALSINNNDSQRLFGNSSLLRTFGNSIFSRTQSPNNGNQNIQSSPGNSLANAILSPIPADDDRTRISNILRNRENSHSHKIGYDNKLTELNAFGAGDFETSYGNNYWIPGIRDKSIDDIFGRKILPQTHPIEFQVPSTILKKVPNEPSAFFIDDADDISLLFDFNSGFGQKFITPSNFGVHVTTNVATEQPSLNPPSDVFGWSEFDSTGEEKACFRRLLSGKRISDGYVRRTMECDRLHDCHRMCEYERGFTCEGFNYRSHPKGICELTSMPQDRVDINRDFLPDSRYDFYERDWTRQKCSQRRYKYRQPSLPSAQQPPNWWSPDRRPSWQYPERPRSTYIPTASLPPTERPVIIPYGGNFMENTRITVDRSRPIDSNHRPPIPSYNRGDSSWHSAPGTHHDSRFPLPVRPIEADYPPTAKPIIDRPRRPDNFIQNSDRFPSQHGYNRPQQYLPARPESNDRIYNGNGYSYGHRWQVNQGPTYGQKYPQRRIGFGPDLTSNEITPQYPDQKKPSKPLSCNVCRNSYSDSHSHDYFDDPKSQRRQPDHSIPSHPRISSGHDLPYGQIPSYGNSNGYLEQPILPPKIRPIYPDHRECSVRSAGGFRLARGIIRKSYLTANLEQCEALCLNQKEFSCLTFAYRYSVVMSSPIDNCLLSEAPFGNLVFYTDLEPDRDYDIYAIMERSKWCESRARPPSPLSSSPRRQRPPDECFWRIRSGFSMPPSVVKKPVRVDGMGECQVECVGSQEFTCRSFVFKYETHSIGGLPNCFLSDWPALDIDPHKMEDMDSAELYERGSFGRGCEPHHPITQPEPSAPSRPSSNAKSSRFDEASCYAGYDRPCKLTPYAIILTVTVDSEADCGHKCSSMRRGNLAPCMSFSYKLDDKRQGDNCYLSDVPTRDLRPGLDYTHDEDYVLNVWKELEPRCTLIDARHSGRPDPTGHGAPSLNIEPKSHAKLDDPYFYEVNVPDPNKPALASNTALEPTHGNPALNEKFFFDIPNELSLFSRYTVDGQPCRRGTKCEKNEVAGFWTCEPEGAEPGSWSYCCEPNHQCGFSEGFKYPWCYVGTLPDQWRPCSETYFPNFGKPRPGIQSSYPRAEDEDQHNLRHWPVAFLHGESPPNGTDSVALANDVKHHTTNESTIPPAEFSTTIEITNSTNSTTHLQRRGTRPRKDDLIIIPMPLISGKKSNVSTNRSESEKFDSRLAMTSKNSSNIQTSSPRFLRDQNSGQFYITKRLNARFPTQENVERPKGGKGAVAKIERITKGSDLVTTDQTSEAGQRLVTVALSKGPTAAENNVKLIVPPISFDVMNSSTVIRNATTDRHWQKVETIDKSHNQSIT